MQRLQPGQETVLSWSSGAAECRVVASAGAYVLLQVGRTGLTVPLAERFSLTYLDGMTPMGWDGDVEATARAGELRFRKHGEADDRRSSVRLPVSADVHVTENGRTEVGRLLDVSAGGLRFRHPGRHEVGDTVRVRLQLPGGPVLDADGVVRAAEPMISSIEFSAMHAATPQDVGLWTVSLLRTSLAAA